MTYGTPVTCRFGAPSRPGPAPERPRGPRLTEAELGRLMASLARAEAQARPAPPPADDSAARAARERAQDARVLAALAGFPAGATFNQVRAVTGQQPKVIVAAVARLEAAGLAQLTREDRPSHPGTRVAALTPAGRAQAEGTA